MTPIDGIAVGLLGLALLLLGYGIGQRAALMQLLEILDREGVEPGDDLPVELQRRVRDHPSRVSTGA